MAADIEEMASSVVSEKPTRVSPKRMSKDGQSLRWVRIPVAGDYTFINRTTAIW